MLIIIYFSELINLRFSIAKIFNVAVTLFNKAKKNMQINGFFCPGYKLVTKLSFFFTSMYLQINLNQINCQKY